MWRTAGQSGQGSAYCTSASASATRSRRAEPRPLRYERAGSAGSRRYDAHQCATAGALWGAAFFHEEHQRNHQRQNRDPHQPEVIDEGEHSGLALDEAVEETVGLGSGLLVGPGHQRTGPDPRSRDGDRLQDPKRACWEVTKPDLDSPPPKLVIHALKKAVTY